MKKSDNLNTDPGMGGLDSRRIESVVEREFEVAAYGIGRGGREGSAAAEHMEARTRRTRTPLTL